MTEDEERADQLALRIRAEGDDLEAYVRLQEWIRATDCIGTMRDMLDRLERLIEGD